jgi:outer membrane protein assembly factor BamB
MTAAHAATAARRVAGWWLGCALALLAACASSDKPKPVALEPLTPQIAGRAVWNQRLDGIEFPLSVAVAGGNFVVASSGGVVAALAADTGREAWRTNVDGKISAGVGSDGRFAAVVTRAGDLVVLDQGKLVWRKPVGGEVVTAPLVAGERVFVLGIDRTVQAFDAADGRRLWSLQRPNDPLTLSQAGVLLAYKDTLVVGQGARLVGVDPLRGSVRWDVAMASPRGTNEVERLADLVGPASRYLDSVCARAFQAAVTCVNAERGNVVWSRIVGGIGGIGGDTLMVFGADASSRVTAWKRVTGEVSWTNESLLYHDLGAPLVVGSTVVFGDAQGMVHWLSREKGQPMLRLPTDGSAIVGAPVVSGTTMLVATRNGGLWAFRPE